MKTAIPGIILALIVAALGACETALERVDRQAFNQIRKTQLQTLGEQAVDPQVVPPPSAQAGPRPQSYERRPGTVNPPARELPAQRAEAVADPLAELPDSLAATAEDPSAIQQDLSAALSYAVNHSRTYRSRQEDLYLTALDLLVQKHIWGPRFFQRVEAQFVGDLDAADRDDAMRLIHEAGVTQRLPYGGQVAATALVQYVDLLRQGDGDVHAESLGLSVTLPLLRGAGMVAQEDLIQAHRDLVYATRDFERFRREFLLDIAARYYDLLRQQAEIENLRGQVRNLQWLTRRIQALADAGRQPYFEVQRSEQQVLFARNNLLNRREAYESSLDAFKLLLGMEITQALVIKPSEVVIAEPALDASQAVGTALDNRLDLQTTQDRIDDARRRVEVARNDTLPGLDLAARVNLDSEQNHSIALDERSSDYLGTITFDAPWDRQIERIRWRAAVVNYERAQRSYSLARDQVIREVRSSIRRIVQARSTLALQNRNIDIARTRLRGVLLRLRSLGPRDFIEAQDDLTEARNRRDIAVRDLRVSILQFLLDTGQMRVRRDGQWDPPAGLVVPDGNDPLELPQDMLDPQPQDVPQMDVQAPAQEE